MDFKESSRHAFGQIKINNDTYRQLTEVGAYVESEISLNRVVFSDTMNQSSVIEKILDAISKRQRAIDLLDISRNFIQESIVEKIIFLINAQKVSRIRLQNCNMNCVVLSQLFATFRESFAQIQELDVTGSEVPIKLLLYNMDVLCNPKVKWTRWDGEGDQDIKL